MSYVSQPVMMPYPGRRAKKVATWTLATILIFLTIVGGILPVLPGMVNLLFPASQTPQTLPSQKSSKGTNPSSSGPGVPLPPGTVQSGARSAPIVSEVANASIAPHLTTTVDSYVYQTSYGTYYFNRSAPFLFKLSSQSGTMLTERSYFFVAGSRPFAPGASNVLVVIDHRFEVSYEVISNQVIVGHLLLQVDFQATARPKFTISFNPNSAWTLGDFNIVWDTVTVQPWLRAAGSPALDLRTISTLRDVGNSASVDVGASDGPSTWTEWLTTDWSDAPGARLSAGILDLSGLSGRGHEVVFPRNRATIDPTQVTTSTASFATGYSTQRKVVSYAGKYYVFFYSGSNIIWKSSIDQVTWSTGFVAGGGTGYGGTIGYNFDVYQSGPTIALAWLYFNSGAGGDGTTALYFRKGTLFAGDISWQSPARVTSWSQPYSWPPSVAIGTDGTFWVAGIWYDSSQLYNIWIYKSTDGSTFSLSTNYLTSGPGSRDDALQLVPLPQGKLMSLTSHYYDQTIRSTIWNPLSSTGGSWSSVQSFNVSLPANTPKWNLISATTTPDGLAYLVYEKYTGPSSSSLGLAHYNVTSNQWTIESTIGTCSAAACYSYPSLSSDNLGNLYVFWTIQSGTSTFGPYFVSRAKGDFNWNVNSVQPFGSISNPTWLSASRTSTKEVLLAWTQGSASPYSIYLGTIPLPSGIASGPPSRPWSYQGLSPYEQYFTQNGEYVSPGNGLLTVSQTDISDAGRNGLSLSISRVYSQPFTFDQGNPLNYETNPYGSLGNGWQLNLPWVTTQYYQGPKYLHFLNGEIFPIIWNNITTVVSGDLMGTFTMTNHQTEDFILNETMDLTTNQIQNYKLVTKDGTTYNFNTNGFLTTIIDRTGQNQLSFSYNTYLSTITDTVGRVATFKYDSNNHLANVTYAGQIVKYSYSGSNLVTVTDAVSRKVTINYSPQSSWLISGIVNTAGGNSTYTYGSIPVGTDALNYYVTLQTVYNPGQVVKSSSFSYNITDGEITNTSVKQSDGQTVQGYTNYLFNAQSSSMTRTVLNATLTQMLKDQFWFDPATGRSVQDDTYSGTSLARSFYNSRFYDLWGNVIYNRGNTGHESYQSFANTNTQNSFQGPGSFTTSTDGRLFYDDFNGQNLNTTAWVQGGSGTNRATSVSASQLQLQAASSTGGTWQSSWVRSSGSFGYPFYAEVQAENWFGPGTDTISADLIISPQATASNANPFDNNDYLRLALRDGPSYKIFDRVGGKTENTLWSDTSTGVHSVAWKIVLTDRDTLSVYLNRGGSGGYVLSYSTTNLKLSSSFAPAYVYLSFGNTNTSTYYATFDFTALSLSNSVTINTLQAGQKIELYEWNNLLQASGTVAAGQTSVTLDATQLAFPYGYFKIYELDGRTAQFTSPTREVWGGSTYSYTKPFRSGGTARTSTGFLQSSTVFVDDALPSGATSYADGGDAWAWASISLAPVVSGTQSHVGFAASGTHEHYFNGTSTTLFATSGYYLIQYVYIPSSTPPSEIMLQFHTVGGTWEHRAYWGTNSITACGTTGPTCGTNGTPSRLSMGSLPSTQNSWVLLIVKTDDVGVNGLYINGWAYTLYNGGVYWDYSAIGTSATGSLTVNNFLASQKVELYDAQGNLKVSATVASGQTSISLNAYGAGINAFPFRGSLKVYTTTGSLQYSSPLMIDIWGGDIYSYNQPVFSNSFNPGSTGVVIHNLLIGSSQYQNSTSTPEESYMNYDSVGDLLQNSMMHNGLPLTTAYTYDSYGNKLSAINPANGFSNPGFETGDFTSWSQTNMIIRADYVHSGRYSAAPSYNPSTQVYSAFTLQQNFLLAITATGLQFWQFDGDPNGLDIAQVLYSDGTSSQTTLTYVSSWTLESLTFTKEVVGLKIVRSAGSGFNIVLDDFSITGQKTYYSYSTTYQHAYLTNTTRVLNSNTNVTTSNTYNFTTGMMLTTLDSLGNRTDYSYDQALRPTMIQNSATSGTRTNMTFIFEDSMNSFGVKNQKSNYTDFMYDGQNRITQVSVYKGVKDASPIISQQNTTYNWQGQVSTRQDPTGNITTYSYDYLGRVTKVTNPDGTFRTTTYDGMNLIQSNYDEKGHRIDTLYNALGNIIGIHEYYSASAYYSTTYLYDGVSNLAKTTDANGQLTTNKYDDLNRLIVKIFPDSFNETRTYDNVGNVISKKDPNGKTITYGYDAFNRLSNVTYPDGSKCYYTYDKNNNILSQSYNGNSVSFIYDSRNRETSETWTISGSQYTLSYGYDGVGNMVSTTYPDGTIVKYSIDALNRIANVTSGGNTLATFTYTNIGKISKVVYGNGVTTAYTYDHLNRPTRIKINQGSSTLLDLNYTFDSVGNVAGINSEAYSYDFLNRLTTAAGGWGTTKFGYDGVGNRLWLYQSPSNTTYTYGAYDRLTGVGSTTYAYDNNGNVKTQTTGSVTTSYTYDFENRLTSVSRGASTLGNYSYSPNGIRVQKIESGITTVYLNKGTNVLYEKQTSGGTTANDYVFVGGQLLARLSGGNTYYFHQDALGSTRLVTNGLTTTFSSNYQPYGPQSSSSGSDPAYKYTQKPQDTATSLYYYGARFYNTTIGRFISRDPAQPQTNDPQTLNPYSYARNNPEKLTDPTGAYWVYQWSDFGWTCVSWFWGWCTFAVPYLNYHIGVYEGSFSLQATIPIFGWGGSVSASSGGGFPYPDYGAFWWGFGIGLGIDAAIAVSLWAFDATGQIWWGGYAAAAALFAAFAGAVWGGMAASSNPNWRSGYFLGLLIAASVFFMAIVNPAFFYLLPGSLLFYHDPTFVGAVFGATFAGLFLGASIQGAVGGLRWIVLALALSALGAVGLTGYALYERSWG